MADHVLGVGFIEIESIYKSFLKTYSSIDREECWVESHHVSYPFPESAFSLGIDLPSWFANTNAANNKLMIIAMDPKRNHDLNKILMGTPFSLDTAGGRETNRNKYWDLIEPLTLIYDVYITDIYKFYFEYPDNGRIKLSNQDENFCNALLHDLILTKEFNVVDPDRILIMGKRAWHAFIRLVKSSKELEITCEDKMKLDYKLMNSDKEIPVSYMPHISNNNLQKILTVGQLFLSLGRIMNDPLKEEIGRNIIVNKDLFRKTNKSVYK